MPSSEQAKSAEEVYTCIQVFAGQLGCKIIELNVQKDHVHLVTTVPPKVSISKLMGTIKRQNGNKSISTNSHI